MKSRCNRKVDIYVSHYFLCSLSVLVAAAVVVVAIHMNININILVHSCRRVVQCILRRLIAFNNAG